MHEGCRAPLSATVKQPRRAGGRVRAAAVVVSRVYAGNGVRHQAIVLSAMFGGLVCVSLYTLLFTCCVVVGPGVRPSAGQTGPGDWRDEPPRHRIFTATDGEDTPTSHRRRADTDDGWDYRPAAPRPLPGGIPRVRQNGARQLPQAIIIGVKKGGTRALLEFIRVHPDVRAPGPESHFFDRHYERGLEWYRQQMPLTIDGQMTIEKTPSYFITKAVPARVYNMSRSVKLIVVVRDPVTRTVSDYTQAVSKRPDLPAFHRMAFVDNSSGLVDTSWGAIRIGVYAKHLERWLRHFPLRQLHFVSGERLIADPAGTMAAVQDFLGLKRVVGEKHFYFNTTKGFPCLKKPEGSSSPHCLGKAKGRPHPHIERRFLQRLRDFYRPFNQKFYQITGQNFGWL